MDKKEAESLLCNELARLEKLSYEEILPRVLSKDVEVLTPKGESGVEYQIEIEAMWDGEPNGDIRVMGAIDDGVLPGAMKPLARDFIVSRSRD